MNPEIIEVLEAIDAAGGRAYLTGGAVIDRIQQRPMRDLDFEVYNLSNETLVTLLNQYGTTNYVGKSFGVHVFTGHEGTKAEFSIPRREIKTGVKHTDFQVILMPGASFPEAARRRDLTINALLWDPLDGSLVDSYGGLPHLTTGTLQYISKETFQEDPLRVLRVMQLLARKGRVVHADLMKLCQEMYNTFYTISKERVYQEFRKLLMKADKPSVGLWFLFDCNWIEHFPALFSMVYCRQNPEHHPEGTVWQHTLHVVDEAAKRKHLVPDEWEEAYMWAALLHDMGKPFYTDPETLTAHGHASQSAVTAQAFLRALHCSNALIDKVTVLCREHMVLGDLWRSKAPLSSYRRLNNKVRLDVLAFLLMADENGRGPNLGNRPTPAAERALEIFEHIGEPTEPEERILLGRHLLERNLFTPGPEMGSFLNKAYDIQMASDETYTVDSLIEATQRECSA